MIHSEEFRQEGTNGFHSGKPRRYTIQLSILIGLAFPFTFTIYFYLTYAQIAWFVQDDFGFLDGYRDSIKISQLIDFSNFGRFISRNIYWNLGIRYFLHNSQYYFILNLFTISTTSTLLYKIFSRRHNPTSGVIAGLLYFCLPATIEAYAWISNSQHILGHLFVVLFIYIFTAEDPSPGTLKNYKKILALLTIILFGFFSNIFMSMVLTLPVWMALFNKRHRKEGLTYATITFGSLLFIIFYFKLLHQQTEAYSTSYNLETISKNINFYFSNNILSAAWATTIALGTSYATAKKRLFSAWLFIASAAFFIPFAFLEHQRYVWYGTLTYLFFLLAVWSFCCDTLSEGGWSHSVKYVGLFLVILVFSNALNPHIRVLTETPRGAPQKHQIEILKKYASQHPDAHEYCFFSKNRAVNATGVKVWDIPSEWGGLQFGTAFSVFVDHKNNYALLENASNCDATFELSLDGLKIVKKP